jgi:hypothetical protein
MILKQYSIKNMLCLVKERKLLFITLYMYYLKLKISEQESEAFLLGGKHFLNE